MKEIDDKVFLILNELKSLGLVTYDDDFCKAIGLLKQNLVKIKAGKNHFTLKHIKNMSIKYMVNPNYLFGLNEKRFLPLKPLE